MNRYQWVSMGVAAISLAGGCVSRKSTGLQISGTPGALFTAKYSTDALSGTVKSVATERPSQVIDVTGKNFTCDVSKQDRAASLTAEVLQRGKTVYRAEAPAGTQGVRISRVQNSWQLATY